MNAPVATHVTPRTFPRYFKIGGAWINSYKVLLIVGIYVGSLTAAALAQSQGRSPLRVGLGAMTCALIGLIGARLYHVLVYASLYLTARSRHLLWDVERGGWSVFGALITFVTGVAGCRMADRCPRTRVVGLHERGRPGGRGVDPIGVRLQRLLCRPRDATLDRRAAA